MMCAPSLEASAAKALARRAAASFRVLVGGPTAGTGGAAEVVLEVDKDHSDPSHR